MYEHERVLWWDLRGSEGICLLGTWDLVELGVGCSSGRWYPIGLRAFTAEGLWEIDGETSLWLGAVGMGCLGYLRYPRVAAGRAPNTPTTSFALPSLAS